MKAAQKTKDKILETATELFLEKGFDRTTVREISSRARINVALMNYYFRSKEILFETIIEMLIGESAAALKQILDSDIDLFEKIKLYISKYIDILTGNPLLVSFVLTTLNRNPEKLIKMKVTQSLYNTENFINQIEDYAKKGKIKEIDPEQFYINMLSLIAFPFAIKAFINDRNNFTNREFMNFIKERKEVICDTMIASLRL